MDKPLPGRVALVTGSTGDGMGRSIALTLARAGANIIVNYGTGRPGNQPQAEEVARLIAELGSEALAVQADTTDEAQVVAMVAAAQARFGPVDILVVNAGSPWQPRDIVDIPLEFWRRVLAAELDGAFLCLKHVLPTMRARRWGRIVLLGMDGTERWNGPPYDAVLGKAGRHALMRLLARQEIKHGITVNTIAPGYTRPVPLAEALAAVRDGSDWQARGWAKPQDVAEAVVYLCSEAARFVTGSVIALANNPFV
ncbi:MAG: SDR family oxidoreductase [Chloroflexi bacterium]|nr:SDR family oxidoreductase [Chloroflexota bacterium]